MPQTSLETTDSTTDTRVRRAALWGLVFGSGVNVWGLQWDIKWHVLVGRDSFWIPPHLMTYSGVTLCVLLSYGILARDTLRARRGLSLPRGARYIAGLAGSRGFLLAAAGITLTVLAAPIDEMWHRLVGLDPTVWSPPHLMGIAGCALNTLACLTIGREVYGPESRARVVVIVLAGAILYDWLHFVLDPTIELGRLRGGLAFQSYAMLASLLMPLALVPAATLSARRGASFYVPALVIVFVTVGNAIARLGFHLIQPLSAGALAIERDNWMLARPGSVLLDFIALLPAAAMAFTDARRRPVVATVAYGAVLFVVLGAVLRRLPSFQPVIPGTAVTAAALVLTLVLAGIGGWMARGLARALD